jgi:hypothetical protein
MGHCQLAEEEKRNQERELPTGRGFSRSSNIKPESPGIQVFLVE